jgi:hypothetical protein
MRRMRANAGWRELPVFAALLMAGMILVMWAQRPAAGCALRVEPHRRLVLSRQVDREHLEADLATIGRVARRDALSSTDAATRQTRFLECETALVEQLAPTHGLSPERIRGAPVDVQ